MFLLDDILLAPLQGVIWVAEKIKETAEKTFFDESAVKADLANLQRRFELKQITEEECAKQEDILLQRLEEIRNYKEEAQK